MSGLTLPKPVLLPPGTYWPLPRWDQEDPKSIRFPKEFLCYLFHSRTSIFYLPTENVLRHPGDIPTIKQGKYYETDWFIKDGELVHLHQLQQHPTFRGTGYETHIYLIEVWEDLGDDGHVSFQHIGYTFVTYAALKDILKRFTIPGY